MVFVCLRSQPKLRIANRYREKREKERKKDREPYMCVYVERESYELKYHSAKQRGSHTDVRRELEERKKERKVRNEPPRRKKTLAYN